MNSRTKGILCILTSAMGFALMSLFVRLSGDLPSMQKAIFRNLVAFLLVGGGMVKNHEKAELGPGDLKYLVMRSAFGTVGIFGNFYAIDHLVLSDANMLNKLSPFFAILFSFLLLRERVTLIQGISVVIAFIGALFIIKPSADVRGFASLAGFLGGAGAGMAYTCVRILGKRGVSRNLIVTFFSGFSCLAALPFVIGSFQPMTWLQTLCLILAGCAATCGQIFVTKAYFYAPAKEISVYDYSQILFSAMLGFLFLGQIPDRYSILGYCIICATAVGMFFYNRERE